MAKRQIGIGLVGAGGISRDHHAAILSNKNVKLVGITRRNKSQLKKMARKWHVTPFDKVEDLLADERIDAAFVLTPSWLHYKHSVMALDAGKHVLVEKPVALSTGEISSLKKLARRKRRVCMPAHNEIYNPAFIQARKIIERGQLGKIMVGEIFSSFAVPRQVFRGQWRQKLKYSGGGTLIDSGMHLFYELIYLLGIPKSIAALTARRYHDLESEDVAQVSMQYRDGTIATIFQSWVCDDRSPYAAAKAAPLVRVLGTKGTVTISDALYLNKRKVGEIVPRHKTFHSLLVCFVGNVQGKVKPLSDLDDARDALHLALSAYKARDKGRKVFL